MSAETKAWWRGTFPAWIVTGLLGILALMADRLLKEHDYAVQTIRDNSARIVSLEQSAKYQDQAVSEIKQMVRELRDEVRKRP